MTSTETLPEVAAAAPRSERERRLPESASFLLDLFRLSAALMVVAAHSGHPEFSTGFHDRQILGDLAVPAFFVLSGFVIRYVTVTREHTLRVYLIDRASRMYSVVLPAAVVTLALNLLCARLAPAYYGQFFAGFATHPLSRIALNLTFLSQSWSHATVFFIDSPFWSLSYECLYYLGYGLFFYLRGRARVTALTLWAILAGPQVLFLLPVWLLGCCLYELNRRRRTLGYLVALAAVPAGVALVRAPNPLDLVHLNPYRATMLALGTGLAAAGVMLLLLRLADLVPSTTHAAVLRRFRRIADATFAIYLLHYPLMVAADAAGLFRPARPAVSLITLALICLLLILAARPLDGFKDWLRTSLMKLTSAKAHMAART